MSWTPASAGANLLAWPIASRASSSPISSFTDAIGNSFVGGAGGTGKPTWSATGGPNSQPNINFLKTGLQGLTTGANVVAGIGTGDFSLGVVGRTVNITEIQAMARISSNQLDFAIYLSTFALYFGAWYHFSGTPVNNTWFSTLLRRVSGVFELWIDGVKDANTFTVTTTIPDYTMYVGRDPSNYFDGDIPDVAFFKGLVAPTDWFSYTTARYLIPPPSWRFIRVGMSGGMSNMDGGISG